MKKIILLVIITLTSNLTNSQTTKKKNAINKTNSVRYSEEKALELIADYYEFYNADEEYNNPVVRRISNNVFYVKVEYCNGGKDICYEQKMIRNETNGTTEFVEVKNEHFWSSKVLVLTINSSTKYNVKVKESF